VDEPQAARRQMADAPDFVVISGIYFSLEHPHIGSMANWQRSSFTREPSKTKAELRQMLAEAVRNTQPRADYGRSAVEGQKDRGWGSLMLMSIKSAASTYPRLISPGIRPTSFATSANVL